MAVEKSFPELIQRLQMYTRNTGSLFGYLYPLSHVTDFEVRQIFKYKILLMVSI